MRRSLARLLSEARRVSASSFAQAHPYPYLVPIGYRTGTVEQRTDATAMFRQDESGRVALFGPHPLAGQVIVLAHTDGGPPFTIGRADGSSLMLSDDAISLVHCELRATMFGVTVLDLGSTNGTRLNDVRVQPRTPTPVEDGDVLTFGRYRFQLLHPLSLYNELASIDAAEQPGDDTPEGDESVG